MFKKNPYKTILGRIKRKRLSKTTKGDKRMKTVSRYREIYTSKDRTVVFEDSKNTDTLRIYALNSNQDYMSVADYSPLGIYVYCFEALNYVEQVTGVKIAIKDVHVESKNGVHQVAK